MSFYKTDYSFTIFFFATFAFFLGAATSFPEVASIVSKIFSVISFGSLIAFGERSVIILSNLAFSSLRSMLPDVDLGEKDLESFPLPSFLAKQLLHNTGLPFLGSKGI